MRGAGSGAASQLRLPRPNTSTELKGETVALSCKYDTP